MEYCPAAFQKCQPIIAVNSPEFLSFKNILCIFPLYFPFSYHLDPASDHARTVQDIDL